MAHLRRARRTAPPHAAAPRGRGRRSPISGLMVVAWAHLPQAARAEEPAPRAPLGPPLASAAAGAWAGFTLGRDAGLASPALSAPAGAATAAALDLALRGGGGGPAPGARTLSLAAHGAWLGRQLGRSLTPFHLAGADRWPAVASVGAEAGALAWAWRAEPRLALDSTEWWLISGATAAGHLGGDAIAAAAGLDQQVGRAARAGLQTGGGLAAGGAMLWAALNDKGAEEPLQPLVVAGQGAWVGAWLPRAAGRGGPDPLSGEENPAQAAAFGGAALGWSLGTLTEAGPAAPQEALSLVAWSVVGTSLARGPVDLAGGLAADQAATLSMLAGGAAGSLAGTQLARLGPLGREGDGGAAFLVGGGQLFAAAQAGIWGVVVDEAAAERPAADRARRRTGAGLLAYGLGSGATLSAPLWAEIDRADVLRVGSLSAWGGWAGAAGGLALGAEAGPHALATGLGMGVGAATGLGLLPLPARADRSLIIDGVGLLGAGLGAGAGALLGPGPRATAGGAWIGSAAGLGLGLQLSRPGRRAAPTAAGPSGRGIDEINVSWGMLTSAPPGRARPGIVNAARAAAKGHLPPLRLSVRPWSPPDGGPTGAELQLWGGR